MRKTKKCHGVIIPLITPFSKEGLIDSESLKKLLDFILQAETFPFILGTTGESLSMPVEQRIEYAKKVKKIIGPDKMLYAGISDNSFANTISMAKEFDRIGVDIFVAHIPSYYPLNDSQILNYFKLLADVSPRPLMLYNIPSTTNISLSLDIVDELSDHPNIVGLKDSERSLDRYALLAEKYADNPNFSIMSGWTAKSCHTLISGFDGIVPSTGNAIPALFKKMYDAVIGGDQKEAQMIQLSIDPYADLHQKNKILSEVIPALKIMMNEVGLCDTHVLWPLSDLSQSDDRHIRQTMKSLLNNS